MVDLALWSVKELWSVEALQWGNLMAAAQVTHQICSDFWLLHQIVCQPRPNMVYPAAEWLNNSLVIGQNNLIVPLSPNR